MPAPILKITLYKKAAQTLVFTHVNRVTQLGIALTAEVLTFTVRREIDFVTFEFQLTTGSGITHDPDQGANPGKFSVAISTANSDLPLEDHVFDIWRDDEVIVDPRSAVLVELTVRQP